jgi:quinoprotein glucose dehydrogenase
MVNLRKCVLTAAIAGIAMVALNGQQNAGTGGWATYGGDKAFTRYSPLDQINRDNVKNLHFVWKRGAVDPLLTSKFPDISAPDYFRGTPIMVDGVRYAPNGVG